MLDGVAQEHEALVVGALLEQGELVAYAVRQRRQPAADGAYAALWHSWQDADDES